MWWMALIGAAAQGLGQQRQGESSAEAARNQAQLDLYNAELAEIEAENTLRVGRVAEAKHRTKGRLFKGQQIAGMGGSGMDVGSGTNIDITMDTERGIEADALTIRTNAREEARGHVRRANLFRWQSDVNENLADDYESAGWLGAGGTFLSGAAQAYGMSQRGNGNQDGYYG